MGMPSNTPPRNSAELQKHFSDTYFSLRIGLTLLAFSMPFVLYLYGKFRHGLDLQPSMNSYLPAGHDPAKFRRAYKSISIAMILFPIPGVAVAYLFGVPSAKVFFIEAAGILTFGVYWAVKSRELALSRLEKKPCRGAPARGITARNVERKQ